MTQPSDGARSAEEVLAAIRALQARDLPTRGGHTLAYVYDSGVPGLHELGAAAYASAMDANALDPTAFPSLAAMEGDLVATAAALVGGGRDTVGTVTSGGTESCLLAVAAARDGRPDIAAPRMVIASSAHAAFHKAAHYFGVAVDMVAVDPVTLRADAAAMAAALTDETVLVVASAPSYAHGVIDPIRPIAAAAAARGVRCHVDACIGGWILGSWRAGNVLRRGAAVAPFGLDVPGVTSVSVDLHKYAYTPKGASVLLHAGTELRASQFFVATDWPGYAMLNTTLQSTRSGGPIAAAWAVTSRLGRDGYREIAERTARAVDAIRDGVGRIEGLVILGDPDATLLAVTAAEGGPNVFAVADEMAARGYYIQPQFAFRGAPASLHMTVTAANAGHEEELVGALTESARAAAALPDAAFPPEVVDAVLAADLGTPAGLTAVAGPLGLIGADGRLALPSRMAAINVLLNALPGAAREQVLRAVLSMLNAPGRDLLNP
jgi:glutamate/tyrosine decarboxylase-like PLP-dependent enzyme